MAARTNRSCEATQQHGDSDDCAGDEVYCATQAFSDEDDDEPRRLLWLRGGKPAEEAAALPDGLLRPGRTRARPRSAGNAATERSDRPHTVVLTDAQRIPVHSTLRCPCYVLYV